MKRNAACITVGLIAVMCPTGCVSVDTPKTKVNVGITSLNLPGGKKEDSNAAPYAKQMKRVTQQQAEVTEQFAKRDWKDLVKESCDWSSYTRELAGYANTSHNPVLFRSCCDQLALQTQNVREAALRHDDLGVERALAACDAPLNRLVQNFPLTRAPGQAAVASPPPAPAPAASPSTPPAHRPLVP